MPELVLHLFHNDPAALSTVPTHQAHDTRRPALEVYIFGPAEGARSANDRAEFNGRIDAQVKLGVRIESPHASAWHSWRAPTRRFATAVRPSSRPRWHFRASLPKRPLHVDTGPTAPAEQHSHECFCLGLDRGALGAGAHGHIGSAAEPAV
ncbi:hypothetical protein [Variovorax paradoxus]|uniref:hypothetical protein n=1 Tax=Variovorax paradoxus TaxID=34073 RepID=UPI0012BD36EA|nr:hypothetical protein [Variovorax paradoxus]